MEPTMVEPSVQSIDAVLVCFANCNSINVHLVSMPPVVLIRRCKIVQLIGDKSIGNLLLVAFQTRYKEVLIKAHTASSALTPKFLTLLTKEETKLYDAAKSSTAAFKTWRMGGPRFQKASLLGRKRKPVVE
ncbi:DNA replication complex GINS protein PSF3-like protein [Tanacetum coccineum]